MVYIWCTVCQARESACTNTAHKAQGQWHYRADFILGGRSGKRIRKVFPRKKDADDYERVTVTDYKRGLFLPQPKKDGKLSFGEMAQRYYDEHCLKENRNPEGSTKYRVQLAKELLGKKLLKDITRTELRELQTVLRDDRDWEASTVNRFFALLKAIFYKAMEWELLDKNPAEFITKLIENDPIPRFLTQKEINQLRSNATEQRLQDYITFLVHTGIRPSAAKSLTWDQVDLENRVIHVMSYKGRKPYRYSVPIDDSNYEVLIRRAAITKRVGKVLDTVNIDAMAKRAIEDSEINKGKPENQHFTIYGLKHCYASHLLMSGVSIDTVRQLLGHTDTRMVMKHYGHLTQEHLRKAQAMINLTPKDFPRPSQEPGRGLVEGEAFREERS